MPSPPGTNFVVHGTKPDGGAVDYGPFDTFHQAQNTADTGIENGDIVDYYITYTDVHGNTIEYDNV